MTLEEELGDILTRLEACGGVVRVWDPVTHEWVYEMVKQVEDHRPLTNG